jgi:signal transduction histidine kinase/ligand-binding sensor domain-containing protein
MGIGLGRAHYVVLGTVLAGVLLAVCPCVFALDPALDVSQYAHTAWRIREGFSKGTIRAIAQTPDGYFWLGTEFGLLRFDGVRVVPWQPPPDQHLPSNWIISLVTARNGTLWIGTFKGLASWKNGKLTQYTELAGLYVLRLLEDREGTVWVGAGGVPTGRLCAIQGGSVHCYGQDGSLGVGVVGLYEDGKGNLWAGVNNGLWRWKPGASNFYSMPNAVDSVQSFAEGDDGTLLIGTRAGITRLVDRNIETYLLPGAPRANVNRMLRDRAGGLWVGTNDRGLVHLHQGRTDVFAQADGLSGNGVSALLEDREGSVWVATTEGLDRFRNFAVTTFAVKQGLSNDIVHSVLADNDGSVWIGTRAGLDRWNKGQITIAGTGSAKRDGKINEEIPTSLFQDRRGRIWAATVHGFGYFESGRFVQVSGLGGNVHSIAEDNAENLWLANQDQGLLRVSPQGGVQQIPWTGLGHTDYGWALVADPSRGGLWIGFPNGGVAYFADGGLRASYSAGNGLGEGRVGDLQVDPDGTLWAATEGGLSRLKTGRIATLGRKNGLPCDTVSWAIEDNDHSFWLYMPCGLVRVARTELDAWAAAAEKDKDTKQSIRPTVFDSSDGVTTRPLASGYSPNVAKTSDGRLWFTGVDGVSVVDPRNIVSNKLPPPVHVEQIVADHKMYSIPSAANGNVRLPPRVRDLQIDYTALSLVAPEKVVFRYKLEGWDRDWQDAGTRRQVFYSNLPPRKYTFRVKACNNSGVWNEAGTALDFAIAPAYWQTWWFRSLCVVGFLGLVIAGYQMRVHQVEQQYNALLEGRVAERTRIARDLHDTLLQSFQGMLLKLHAITYVILDRPAEAHKQLETAIDQARQAVTEGRDAIQGMRSSTLAGNDLARAINLLCDELTAQRGHNPCPAVQVQVEGTSRDLAPLLRDDIYRISGEALRNAFLHSQATGVEVEIRYDARQFRLRIRDNGKGIDRKVLESGAREGHYGLPGMRERARLVGGKLTVWSELDSGTEIELTIPAAVAYAKSGDARRSFFRRKSA